MNNYKFKVPDDIFNYKTSYKAKLIYMYLCNCEQNNIEYDIAKITKACSCNEKAVNSALDELLKANLIQKQ